MIAVPLLCSHRMVMAADLHGAIEQPEVTPMAYVLTIVGLAVCLVLVRAAGLPTEQRSCASTPKGSIITLLDCPPRPATSG